MPPLQAAASPAAQPSSEVLTVIVVAGRNGTNILRPPSAAPPVIEVRDNSDRPVAGAIVKFSAPVDEPGVKFPNGRPTYSLVTDLNGRVAVENMTPSGVGKFEIDVTATYLDASTTAHIREANYPNQKLAMAATSFDAANQVHSPSEHHMSTGTKVGIIAAIAVAAGLGAYFGLRGGHSTSGSVAAGTATVGAP
ncbi:MAG TPA: hypothetical protein VH302_08940 [Bryobacteraceae bacterium]|nr:hypothetical protein [Bryobacteraceae bacterium]